MNVFSTIKKSELEGSLRIDAEYYQPEYLESKNILSRFETRPLSELSKISDGNHMMISESFLETGIRYLRGKDLNDFFISNDDPIYIPESEYRKLKRSYIFKDDILVSIVGTVGLVSIVADAFDKLTGSCKIAILRSKEIDPWFLSAFLLTRYGQHQIQRKTAGAVQMGIILKDLATLDIPVMSKKEQLGVKEIVQLSYKKNIENEKFYSQAENLLLEELGLKNFESEIKRELWNVVDLSEAKKVNRIDADYFQPKYQKLMSLIRANSGIAFGELAMIKKGFEPGSEAYQEEGKTFIRVSSISKDGVIDKDQKYLKEELYEKLKKDYQPKVGEILLTKDASPGVAYVIKEPIEGIVSGGVLKVRTKENIEPEYLALVINSVIGQLQVERDAGGSIIMHWKLDQVKEMQIPILPKPIQEKIAELVRKSHEARKKAKELLEEAKHKVEELIEK